MEAFLESKSVQLALVGLHRPFQGGIDSTRHEKTGVRIAISVVASGGYPDELSCSGELVYTGSGKKDSGDQKLEHGNLALKNCIKMKTPVRVIHGFKDQNREEGSHSRAREISTFTYDGLIMWWTAGEKVHQVQRCSSTSCKGSLGNHNFPCTWLKPW